MKIINYKAGKMIHELENAESIKEVVEDAVKKGISLAYVDLRNADLKNANLENADFRNADLRNADLRNANLENAYLRNANLNDINLYNAKFFSGVETSEITQISGLEYHIFITDNHIKIGRKCYTKTEWANFTDDEISEMDEDALGFWLENKKRILMFADCLEE